MLEGDTYYSLDSLTEDMGGAFWESAGPATVARALVARSLPEIDVENVRIGSPIARPSSVFCIGMNYAAHAAESGSPPPQDLVLFHKAPTTVVGTNDAVAIPRGSSKTDWEVELGIVINRRACYPQSPGEVMDHVAGFVAVNNLSEGEFQLEVSGGQWSKGKSCVGFCPTAPVVVTPDEVGWRNLRLRSWVNGDPRQESSTADMISDVETIVHTLSQYLVLEPGDLICTVNPQGVALSGCYPFLVADDIVEIEVEDLGRQRERFVQA